MSIFSKLFGKKQTEGEETSHVGGMEDFMTLIRVYYQSVMACNIGITNINFLPDMAVFKRTLKIPTQNNMISDNQKTAVFGCLKYPQISFLVSAFKIKRTRNTAITPTNKICRIDNGPIAISRPPPPANSSKNNMYRK